MTGAFYLARFRRSALLIDDGCNRAAKIPRARNLPGYPDGSGSSFQADPVINCLLAVTGHLAIQQTPKQIDTGCRRESSQDAAAIRFLL